LRNDERNNAKNYVNIVVLNIANRYNRRPLAAQKDPRTPSQIALARKLGASIAGARRESGLSQDELAWKADVHRAYMGFIEQGRYSITVATLVQVCEQLGVKPSQILKEIGQ